MKTLSIMLGTAVALALTSPAVAASADYYLIIDGVDGESSAAKIESWSFGVSNPSSTPVTASAGRVITARDAGSGMATGRTSGGVVVATGDVDGDGVLSFAETESLAEAGPLSLTLAAGSPAAAQLCSASGQARSGHILRSDGAMWDLATMKGARCASGGGGAGGVVTVAVTGSMKHTKSGHVTLLK